MRSTHCSRRLLGGTSVLALSVGAVIATAMIAPANAVVPASGLWGGGGSLSSLTLRQILDCYNDKAVSGDGYTLPTACSSVGVEGLYAAVGSGRGQQAFIANDPLQLVNGGPNGSSPSTVSTPALKPPFIDVGSTSTNFNTYPYPGLTFAAGDNPLPTASTLTTVAYSFSTTTNWANSVTTNSITLSGTHAVTYPSTTVGAAVQFPLFEVPVAIAVNTSNLNGLQSAGSDTAAAGGAIQLSTAQVCAIFAGVVTDWNSAAPVSTGLTDSSGKLIYQLFDANNVSVTGGTGGAQPYASSSTPIKVTYRSDGSGTSYIFTNYLKSNCVALDNGSGGTTVIGGSTYTVAANHYSAIFGASSLPSTSFSTLASLVTTNNGSTVTTNWQTGNGSTGVAAAIGDSSTVGAPGAIGYLSADFTTPYATTSNITNAPHSASVQNESQRAGGNAVPSSSNKFIAPTPANAALAFTSELSDAVSASSVTTYAKWDLYQYTHSTSDTTNGKSILGIPNASGAYPVIGTTYAYAYSCYARPASGNPPVVDFLNWYYTDSSGTVSSLLQSNGFNPLLSSLASSLKTQYLSGGSQGITKAGTASTGCSGVTGGA